MLAAGLGNQAAASEYFPGLVYETITTTGATPARFTADAGYFSSNNIVHASATAATPKKESRL